MIVEATVTPAPVITIPTASVPTGVPVTVSVVAAIEPVKLIAPVPVGQ